MFKRKQQEAGTLVKTTRNLVKTTGRLVKTTGPLVKTAELRSFRLYNPNPNFPTVSSLYNAS
jgi:hypothetical protein